MIYQTILIEWILFTGSVDWIELDKQREAYKAGESGSEMNKKKVDNDRKWKDK